MAHEPPGIPAPSSTAKHIEWPKVAAQEEWQKARNALLIKEKALMKQNDALAAERRRLPMVEVPTDYRFLTADGESDLIGLFAGRRQLMVCCIQEADGLVDALGDIAGRSILERFRCRGKVRHQRVRSRR